MANMTLYHHKIVELLTRPEMAYDVYIGMQEIVVAQGRYLEMHVVS